MNFHEIESRLEDAKERVRRAAEALAPAHRGFEWEEYDVPHASLLQVEREIAAARGEEYAVPLDFPVAWDIGAPLPHLLQNDYKTLLIFYVREPDSFWDGSYVTVKDPGDGAVESLALVEFHGCTSAR